jgi:hypothetical protein
MRRPGPTQTDLSVVAAVVVADASCAVLRLASG